MISLIAVIIFWVSVLLMFHSYVFYPLLLQIFSTGKKQNEVVYNLTDSDLPQVLVVFSAFNEEKVIRQKLQSIFNTSYPLSKLKVHIGSDNSTDKTNEIIEEFAKQYSQLHFFPFKERNGKSNVLNKLIAAVKKEEIDAANAVFIFTDANVMFAPTTIFELVKHFKNKSISQVGANILNRGVTQEGISFQEKSYIQRENKIKYLEGLNWGAMQGAFGACYAMRADCWRTIPSNYLMEDFFLSMNVLEKKQKAICEPNAVCFEDVSTEMGEEFKRKTRIQAGNFQNLSSYWQLLFRFDAAAFCFFSHKVIRWFGPLFIAAAYISNVLLITDSKFYLAAFLLQNIILLIPVLDFLLSKFKIHFVPFRFIGYFYSMNAALVSGFVMYVRGVKTNAWNPTKRNL